MKKYYFTFGFGQPIEKLLDYVVIISENYEEARAEMIKNFNKRWAFQYNEEEWKGQVKEFGYTKFITIEYEKQ